MLTVCLCISGNFLFSKLLTTSCPQQTNTTNSVPSNTASYINAIINMHTNCMPLCHNVVVGAFPPPLSPSVVVRMWILWWSIMSIMKYTMQYARSACVFACLLLRGRCECEWVEHSLVYLFIQFSRLAQWTYLTRKSNMMMSTWLCTHAGSVRYACYEKVCITWWFCSKRWAGGQAGSSFYFNLILSLCVKPPNRKPANETRAPQWVRWNFWWWNWRYCIYVSDWYRKTNNFIRTSDCLAGWLWLSFYGRRFASLLNIYVYTAAAAASEAFREPQNWCWGWPQRSIAVQRCSYEWEVYAEFSIRG